MGFISERSDYSLLFSRVSDVVKLSQKRNCPCYLGFLDEKEQAVISPQLNKLEQGTWSFFGGHDDAERKVLSVFPSQLPPEGDDWPIVALTFRYRSQKELSHRDFLGTLLAAGLRRDSIGDILCSNGMTIVFVKSEISQFILDQVQRVGGEGVTVSCGIDGELPIFHRFSEISSTISSDRLDVIVKTLIDVSRDSASRLIVSGQVEVDHLPVSRISETVPFPSVLSIRGYGRYRVDQIGPPTKKGRLVLKARKYI